MICATTSFRLSMCWMLTRRVDVDAGVEQLLDVEIALGMAAAGRVGVGELVDQHELRLARDDARRGPSPRASGPCSRRCLRGMTSRPVEQRLGLLAPVRLDDADDDVDPSLALRARRDLQHLVGLADAGRGAEEDLQPAAPLLFAPGRLEQGVRRGPLIEVAAADRTSARRNSPVGALRGRLYFAAPCRGRARG